MKNDQAKQIIEQAIHTLGCEIEQGHSQTLRRFLDTAAKFYRYSFNNTLLIAVQRPEATRVAGFQANRRHLADRTVETLGLHYAMRWPKEELQSVRPLRRSPPPMQADASHLASPRPRPARPSPAWNEPSERAMSQPRMAASTAAEIFAAQLGLAPSQTMPPTLAIVLTMVASYWANEPPRR